MPPSIHELRSHLKADLAGQVIARARPDDLDAINFALDHIEERTPGGTRRTHPQTGRPLGRSRAKELLSRLSHSPAGERPSINVLIEAIEASGGVAVVNEDRDAGFDLGVWSDDLEAIGGNPLLVELKQTLRPGMVNQVFRALEAHPTAKLALIVYREPGPQDPPPPRAELNAVRFPVLVISLEELIRRMGSVSFAQVVRAERNKMVHGPGPS